VVQGSWAFFLAALRSPRCLPAEQLQLLRSVYACVWICQVLFLLFTRGQDLHRLFLALVKRRAELPLERVDNADAAGHTPEFLLRPEECDLQAEKGLVPVA